MAEFTTKVRSKMPEIPKNEPQGKSDFKTVRELVEYIENDGEKGLRKKIVKNMNSSEGINSHTKS